MPRDQLLTSIREAGPEIRLPDSRTPLAVFLRNLHQAVKTILIVNGHIGKHLPVNLNIGFFKAANKTVVRDSVRTGGGINPRNPKFAEVSFPLPAIPVGIRERFHNLLVRRPV